MKNLFTTTIMLGLLAATPVALAQGEHDQGGNSEHGRNSGHQGNSDNARGHSGSGTHGHFGGNSAGHISAQGLANTNGPNASTRLHGLDRARSRMSAQGLAHSNAINARGHNGSNTHGLLRNTGGTTTESAVTTNPTSRTITTSRMANFSSLQRNVQASHQFHAGAYRQPYGYQSRHWSYGERLPAAYFGREYWISDYAMYSLFAPEDGLVWVRVGDDVMLIDEYTGQIVQVDYGEFY